MRLPGILLLSCFAFAFALAGCEPTPTSASYCSPYYSGEFVFDLGVMRARGTDTDEPIVARRYEDYVVMFKPGPLLIFKGSPATREFREVSDDSEVRVSVAQVGTGGDFVVLTESGSLAEATVNWKRNGVEVYSPQLGGTYFATIHVSPPSDIYRDAWSPKIPCSAHALRYSDFERLPITKQVQLGPGALADPKADAQR